MNAYNFTKLDKILALRVKIRILYWISALLFWLGVLIAGQSNMADIEAARSLVPGVLLLCGVTLYFGACYLTKISDWEREIFRRWAAMKEEQYILFTKGDLVTGFDRFAVGTEIV